MAAPIQLHTTLSEETFVALLKQRGKYKLRSEQTHLSRHRPLLNKNPSEPIELVLLGHSMIERFYNTGRKTPLGGSDAANYPRILNLGVGGDRVANVLFRFGNMGLYTALKQHPVRQAAVVCMGTNDLKPNRALGAWMTVDYCLVLEALQRAAPGLEILVLGLTKRKDIPDAIVDESNVFLARMVQDYNTAKGGAASVTYLAPHPEITTDLLVDHVHLNEKGYDLFAASIMAGLARLRSSDGG